MIEIESFRYQHYQDRIRATDLQSEGTVKGNFEKYCDCNRSLR